MECILSIVKTGKTISIAKFQLFQLKLIDQILKIYQKSTVILLHPAIIALQNLMEDIFLRFMNPKEKIDYEGVLSVRRTIKTRIRLSMRRM